MLFVLALVSACSLFLAATTKAPAMLYVFGASFLALAGYVWVLGQMRQREQAPAGLPAPMARPTSRPVDVGQPVRSGPRPVVRQPDVRRAAASQAVVRQKAHQASVRRQGRARRQATDRWSAAV